MIIAAQAMSCGGVHVLLDPKYAGWPASADAAAHIYLTYLLHICYSSHNALFVFVTGMQG